MTKQGTLEFLSDLSVVAGLQFSGFYLLLLAVMTAQGWLYHGGPGALWSWHEVGVLALVALGATALWLVLGFARDLFSGGGESKDEE